MMSHKVHRGYNIWYNLDKKEIMIVTLAKKIKVFKNISMKLGFNKAKKYIDKKNRLDMKIKEENKKRKYLRKVWLKVYLKCMDLGIKTSAESANAATDKAKNYFKE